MYFNSAFNAKIFELNANNKNLITIIICQLQVHLYCSYFNLFALLPTQLNVQECDARMLHNSTKARSINELFYLNITRVIIVERDHQLLAHLKKEYQPILNTKTTVWKKTKRPVSLAS